MKHGMKEKLCWIIPVIAAILVWAAVLAYALLDDRHYHAYSPWETVRAATCTSEGERVRFCSCGEEERSFLMKLPHTPELVPGKRATVTEAGLTEGKICRVCYTVLIEQTELPPIVPWDGTVADSFAGGSGLAHDPYLIENGAQLALLAELVKQQGTVPQRVSVRLVQDIDLGGLEWTPIGDATQAFCGSFDGDGKYICNFKITEPPPVSNGADQRYGLFGAIRDGSVTALHVEDFEINVTDDATPVAGGIAGSIWKGRLTDCFVDGKILLSTSGTRVGLLAGSVSDATVEECHAEGEILRAAEDLYPSRAGGLIGYTYDATVSRCTANVHVDGGVYAGGLVGYASNPTSIRECTASGAVSAYTASDKRGSHAAAGGLVGYMEAEGAISHCKASGAVSAYHTGGKYEPYTVAGGLVGYAREFVTVSHSFASGNVTADGPAIRAGGLIGYCYFIESVEDCGATGELHIAPTEPRSAQVGGLIGCIEEGAVKRSYATGNVTVENKPIYSERELHAGGLVGHAENASFSSCYATGNVSIAGNASAYAGGLLGYARLWDGRYSSYPVEYCYATGDVSVTYHPEGITAPYGRAGGLLGDGGMSFVSGCFATGDVSAAGFSSPYGVGGFAVNCNPMEEDTIFVLAGQEVTVNGKAVTGMRFGSVCTAAQLGDPRFYTDTLGFDPAVWELHDLDLAAGKLPTLKTAA